MLQNLKRKLAPYYENFFSFWPAGFSPFPTNVMFELLYACNLNCSFCYLRLEENQKKIKAQRRLTTPEILAIIDQVPALTALSFSGGEIMLHNDIIKILRYAKKKHRVGIISNLAANTPRYNQGLVAIGIDTLMTSLDSHEPKIHDEGRGKAGSWQKTVRAIKAIQTEKQKQNRVTPTITINSMILPSNYHFLAEMVKLAHQLQVDWLTFQLLDPSLDRSGYRLHPDLKHLRADNLSQIPRLPRKKLQASLTAALTQAQKLKVKLSFSPQLTPVQVVDYYSAKLNLKKIYCNRVYHLTRISPFGDLYPCFNLKSGSLLGTSLMKLWNSQKYRRFRQQVKQGCYRAQCLGCCHLRLHQK
jgi:MoaA/NifB/PqqE/SkfB family radical SAM enzyme